MLSEFKKLLNRYQRMLHRIQGRYESRWEPDSLEPLPANWSVRPMPCLWAYVTIWDEAHRAPDFQYSFDADSTLCLLHEQFGYFDPDWFIWDRLVELIRVYCRLPVPHRKKAEEGTASMWMKMEYEGHFQIAADWSIVTLRLACCIPKKLPQCQH